MKGSHGREFIVGIVFFLLLGALGVITLVLGNDVFHSTEAVTFRFDDVAGLTTGSEVWINGLPSGTVKAIEIAPDGTVSATARMRNPLAGLDLSKGVLVEIREKSSLGGAVIGITTRRTGDLSLPRTVDEMKARTWSAKAGGLAAAGEGAVESLVRSSEEKPGFLGKALLGNDGLKDLDASLADLKATLKEARGWLEAADRENSVLAVLLKDKDSGDRLKRAVANLEEITAKANGGDGLLGRLLNDAETSKKFDRIMDGLDALSAGLKNEKGSLWKFMNDGSLFDDARTAMTDIKSFASGMNDEKGAIFRLMHDGKLADDIGTAVASAKLSFDDLHLIAQEIRDGKGTLGKLIRDPALYDDLRETLGTLKRSFEEARENAPILTFAGFLFRTF